MNITCWLGLHSWSTVTYLEIRDSSMVEVEVVRCARCGLRAMETIL